MTTHAEPTLLWQPNDEPIDRATLTRFAHSVADMRGIEASEDYNALWRWSAPDIEALGSDLGVF